MTADRLLAIAEWCCGPEARARVFDPLIADWQQEWLAAQATSRRVRARVLASGGLAFALSLGHCALRELCSIPPRGTTRHAGALFGAGVAASLASQVGLALLAWSTLRPPRPVPDPLFIVMTLVTALPPSMALATLPMAALLPLTPGRIWQSFQVTMAAALLTFASVAWLIPKAQGPLSTLYLERVHERQLADDAAGRFTYPGSAMRALRPSTPEQRAAAARRGPHAMTLRELLHEQRARTWIGRSSTTAARIRQMWQLPVVGIAFGVMGIGLASLGRPDFVRAGVWWLVAGLLLVSCSEWYAGRMAIGQLWMIVIVFTGAGVSMLIRRAMTPAIGPTSPAQ